MKQISSSRRLPNPLREFFFHLTFSAASTDSWAILCFLAGKLQSLSQPLMLIFCATSASRWSDIVSYLEVMTYFRSECSFNIFAFVLFCLVQLFVGLAAFQLLYLRFLLRKGKSAELSLVLGRVLHGLFVASAKVLPQICVSALAYSLARVVAADTAYPVYKHLMGPSVSGSNAQSYVSLTLLFIAAAEVLTLGVAFLGLCQDRSIRNHSFWSANTWTHSVTELCFSVFVQIEFFCDLPVRVSYILRLIARLICVLIFALYTKYVHYWVDLAEFLFATLETAITAFVLVFDLLDWDFEPYVTYPLLLLVLCLLMCLVRARIVWSRFHLRQSRSAVNSIRGLIALATDREHKTLSTLVGLLAIHAQECQAVNCDCRKLIASLAASGGGENPVMQLEETVHLRYEELPPEVRASAIAKAMRLLIDEVATRNSKGGANDEELAITMAEASFYIFGNFYSALQQISQIEADKPRLMTRQRTYNLRRVISLGMQRSETDKEDPERTLSSLKYLKYYHKFLDQVEDATESTIKFWSIVGEEAPSSNRLNSLGKALFECKYHASNTVEKISRIATNHVDFLVRYGLFMRFVMHDLISSEQTFQKIQSLNANADLCFSSRISGAAANFSIFRFDATPVMLMVAQMERTGMGTIAETNTAVEQVLGYSRRDAIGSSIANIMPQTVSSVHDALVQRFFQTMKSYNIDVPRARYVKAKDGFYVLCRCLIKIVPELRGRSLQVALFMVEDKKSLCYSSFRRDPTEKKVGSILCVPNIYTVIGFTRAALGILKIPEDRVKEFAGNVTIFDIFPWMAKRELMDEAFAKEGKIVAFQSAEMMGANSGSDSEDSQEVTLLWIRFVVEKSESQTLLISLVVSEIVRDKQERYALEPGSSVFYRDPDLKVHYEDSIFAKQALDQAKTAVDEQRKHAQEAEFNISDVASVASMASVGTSTRSGTNKSDSAGFYEVTRELQIASITKQTPTAIIGLTIGMAAMLVVVGVLMFVGAYMSLKEVTHLETRFELIKTYHLRYKAVMMLTDTSQAYKSYIYYANIDMVNGVVAVRDQALTNYNVATRKLLFSQGLDYDGEMVTVTDLSKRKMQCTFSYALILFSNANLDYTENSQAALSPCLYDMTVPICANTLKIASYAYSLGFYTLRVKQDDVTKRLEAELNRLARGGETTQYTITGICMCLIVASACIMAPIFVWVIRDKSYVLAIFSDISPEEAKRIIEDSRQLDIKNLRFKRKWITRAGEDHEAFWRKVVSENRKGFGNSAGGKKAQPDKALVVAAPAAQDADEDEDKQAQLDSEQQKRELENAKKKQHRRERLSEIDYSLRNMFVVRMICVLLLFLCYGAFQLYFNYYVHNKNAEASEMLFSFCKRSLYVHTLNYLLVEAININSTAMLGTNPDSDGQLFMGDIANEMMIIEAKTKEFRKSGSRMIYGEFLDLMEAADGSSFCNISDTYSDIAITSTTTCSYMYHGPTTGGLSAGISYVLEEHIKVAHQFLIMNFSDTATSEAFAYMYYLMTNIGPVITFPLSFVLGGAVTVFYDCAMRFFSAVRNIVYGSSIGFAVVFAFVYVFVFARFIATLNEEIWHTRGMINIIPADVLEENLAVREQVWMRKGLK